jgi:hypothetical protein
MGRVFLRYWPISEIELIKKAEYPAGFLILCFFLFAIILDIALEHLLKKQVQ